MTRLLIAVCVLGLTFPKESRADPAAQARFHDGLARSHYAARRYEDALREFFLEQRVSPNPRIAFNIALCFQELARPEDAFLYFREYLASDDADEERRSYSERTVASLAPTLALVSVASEPAGASIFVDKREHGSYGSTPKVIALAAGEHEVSVELAGYRPAAAKVVAVRGEQVTLALTPARIVGKLHVETSTAGHVTVRTAAGESQATGEAPLYATLPPGSYEVEVRAPGYLPWTGLANIEPDQQTELQATPQPLPTPSGDITVTSNVPGALVEVNGDPAGFTPMVLPNVKVGNHQLSVHSPSRLPWRGSLDVRADERAWLTVSLEEPPTVQRSPTTWVVGGLGAASFLTAGVFGILAWQNHDDLENAPADSDKTAIVERGRTLNAAADVALVGGLVATTAAVLLYFFTAETRGDASSASVARSKD